jgi:hypothetical protein
MDFTTRASQSLRRNRVVSAVCVAMLTATSLLLAKPAAAQCTDTAKGPAYQPRVMYSYMTKGRDEAQGGNLHAADQTWRAAYQFMKTHCYLPGWALNIVPLIREGKVQQAFQIFTDDNLMPTYKDVGADKPYDRGLAAAKRGDFATSASEFRNAIKVSANSMGPSRFPEADFMLGMALCAQGRHTEAVRQWQLTLSDRWPAVPEADFSGPDPIWTSALQLYATQRTPPFS